MKIKKTMCALCIVICMLFVAACGNDRTTVDVPVKDNITGSTETVNADVYIDGTFSVAGYVNYQGTTVFVDAVKNIERTIAATWKKDNIQYIKFGDENKIISRDEFLRVDDVEFYDQLNTRLDKVIESADSNRLSVIVTDLFQTNQDTDSLVLAIKRKVLSDSDKAFAIIGLKSQFNGKIYDVGKNLLKFDYASTNSIETYRPFYLLVLGKEKETRNFVKAYKNKYADCKVVMYSKNIGIDTSLLEDTRAVQKKDKNDKAKLMAKINNILGNSNYLQYRLDLDATESKVNLLTKASGNMLNARDKVEDFFVNVDKVEKWTDTGKGNKGTGIIDKILGGNKKESSFEFITMTKNDFAKIHINNITFEKNNNVIAELSMRLKPTGIGNQEGIYRVEFSVLPLKENYIKNIDIFEEWNINDDSWEGIAFNELGSKTLNISKFNRILGEINYELNDPGYHKLFIYFDAK